MTMSHKREGIIRAYLNHYNGKDGRKERRIDRARRKAAARREARREQ